MLEESRLKLTKPRLAVFRLLLGREPQSITQLIAQSKNEIDRVSVYRTIDLFEKLGVVRRVNIGWKYKVELSELFSSHHHHITCLGCDAIVVVEENEALERIIRQLGGKSGFTVVSHQLELQGFCQQCQKRT